MLATFLIVFRESFEAFLVLGIVLAFLSKKGCNSLKKQVYFGGAAAVAVSAVAALAVGRLTSMLSGSSLFLFEGVGMITAAAFITFVGFWALTENLRQEKRLVEKSVTATLTKKQCFGLAGLSFVTVAREGIETVFLVAVISHGINLFEVSVGAAAGLAAAFLMVKEALRHSLKLNRRKFFAAIAVLLLLFSGGLVGNGIKELQLAKAIPIYTEKLVDLSWILPNNTFVAELLSTLFGYNATPSLLQAAGYFSYLVLVAAIYLLLVKKIHRIPIEKSFSPAVSATSYPAVSPITRV